MLIGEPGTAKSYLSELLAAAISRDSTLTIRGARARPRIISSIPGIMPYCWPRDRVKPRWCPPLCYRGMTVARIVRFEEITRCPIEIQDILLRSSATA